MIEMRSKTLIRFLIVLSIFVMNIPRVQAATDEWTVNTVDEDLFYATYKFEGVDMMYLQGDDMQIRSWFWFEGPVLDWGRYIEEAYLEVRTPSAGWTDLDAIMYIYGIPSQLGGTPSHADDPNYINGPYTKNYYQVNLSSFVGPGEWHNITVSRIIREINQGYYFWDGHDIAFATFSPAREAGEERTISTIEGGYPAKLYIHYGANPTPPENETAMWIERRNGLDIYQDWGYENFYEDWTETDSLNLIGTSEVNPYRITFSDFGYEEFWNTPTYFRRDEDLSNTADFIEIRWKATLTAEEVPYHRPDFHWVQLSEGGNNINAQHFVNGASGDEDHHFTIGAEAMTYGVAGMFMADPIPPIKTQWYSFLWDYDAKKLTLRQFTTEPTSTTAWYADFDVESNETGADIKLQRYDAIFAPRSRTGLVSYNGLNWGTLENMLILVDFNPLINGTFFVIDPDTNETLVTDLPDLNSTRDWVDIYQVGKGENPEDPNPGGEWGDDPGLVSRFNVKLIFFVIGMGLFVGTPVWGFATRPEVSTWIIIMMSMLCGVALLWSLQLT